MASKFALQRPEGVALRLFFCLMILGGLAWSLKRRRPRGVSRGSALRVVGSDMLARGAESSLVNAGSECRRLLGLPASNVRLARAARRLPLDGAIVLYSYA